MDLQEDLKESFRIYADISDKVLKKCEELCNAYCLSAEDLSDLWGAYSTSILNDSVPTVEALQLMERKELKGNKDYSFTKSSQSTPKSVKKLPQVHDENDSHSFSVDVGTPKSTRTSMKRLRSPEKSEFQNCTLDSSLTSTQSSHDYHLRTNSGKVELSYGNQNLLGKATFRRMLDIENIKISLCGEQNLCYDARYMYNVMSTKASNLDSSLEWIGKYLFNKFGLGEPERFYKASGLVRCYGRICSDALGKINHSSVILEGSQELTGGNTIKLNFNKLSNYAIFPGQIVAVEGFNPNGTNFITQKMYTDASVPLTAQNNLSISEPLQIVVAVGPFALSNSLSYQPLQDLVKYVTNNKPHVLILIGPFLDSSQETICDITMTNSYNNLFEMLLESVMSPLQEFNIDVILVSSSKDAHHHVVYPTLPYKTRRKYSNLHCFSDPCMIDINGITLGATSTDIMLHLSKQEFCGGPSSDRMSRLASHLLCQQSFYPLYPPDDDVSLDSKLLEQCGVINVIPHILILPSNLRYFMKYVNGCVIINPERLTKGYVGGTFCRIEVFPKSADCGDFDYVEEYDPASSRHIQGYPYRHHPHHRHHHYHHHIEKVQSRADYKVSFSFLILLMLLSALMCLILLGIIKGLIGICCWPPVGMWSLGALIDLPRPLDCYQEVELIHCPVRYDQTGWPVHPHTGKRSVRALSKFRLLLAFMGVTVYNTVLVTHLSVYIESRVLRIMRNVPKCGKFFIFEQVLRTEFFLNTIFFLTYPIAVVLSICGAICFKETPPDDRNCYKCVNTVIFNTCVPSATEFVSIDETSTYSDEESSQELKDTEYVLNQMRCSRQSLLRVPHCVKVGPCSHGY